VAPVCLHTGAIFMLMNNYRILTFVNFLAFIAIGINSPLLTLYLQGLGAGYALISLILTSTILVALVSNPAWGWLADRLGRRKPLYIAGLAGAALGYFWLSTASNVALAWPARLLDALSMAGVSTLGLTLMGDTLDASSRKGRSMGFTRGLASLAFAAGAFTGGRLADAFGISSVFLVCGAFLTAAALVALLLHEVKPAPLPVVVDTAPAAARPRTLGLPVLFLAGVSLWTAAHVASTSMWPNYMEANGYSKTTISSLWSLAALIEMPAMWLGGALSDITGRAVVLAAGGLFIATVQIGYMLLVASLPALLGVQGGARLWLWQLHLGGDDLCGRAWRQGAAWREQRPLQHGRQRRSTGGQFVGWNAGAGGGLQHALSRLCGGWRWAVRSASCCCGARAPCRWLNSWHRLVARVAYCVPESARNTQHVRSSTHLFSTSVAATAPGRPAG
jgi:hypothetical protein